MARNRNQCAACGSLDYTQFGFDEITCLKCRRLTNIETGLVVSLEEQFSPCNK